MPNSLAERALVRLVQHVDSGHESLAFGDLRALLQGYTNSDDWGEICVRLAHAAAAGLALDEEKRNAFKQAIDEQSPQEIERVLSVDMPGVINIVSMIGYRRAIASRDSLDAKLEFLLFCVGDFICAAENIAFGAANPDEWSELASGSRRYLERVNSGLDVDEEDVVSRHLVVRTDAAAAQAGKQAWRRFAQCLSEYLC